MHIITFTRLKEFYEKYPDAEPSLRSWNKLTKLACWQNFAQLRETFASADLVGKLTVFNIAGNKYRLITYIDYQSQKVFVRYVLTHAEYDRDSWKNDPWFR
jgi:mRNA interferase HigB